MLSKSKICLAIITAMGVSMAASAEEIPLFDATPITDSGFSADISRREIFAQAGTTVFCEGPGTGNLQTEGATDNSLIVDNYVTLNDADGQSICTGGTGSLPVIDGTNCFSSGAETGIGDPIETVFTGATAPVDLFDGQNDLVFKLWDWGGVYGNTALELALPENCSSEPIPTTTNLCAAQDLDIGNVNVSNDSDYLYVEFEITEPNWYLEETHVAVGDTAHMTNKPGNPVPGRFPYECEEIGDRQEVCKAEISLDDLESGSGDTVAVAAHAVAFEILSNGCNDAPAFASEVVDDNQGLQNGGDPVLNARSDPTAVYADDGTFFSLGFGGDLMVGFGQRFANGSGDDVCIGEITNGRGSYPEENAEVFGDGDLLAEISNRDGDGTACVGLPDGVSTAEYVTLLDTTDPTIHDPAADGYDVDWIKACYPAQDETAWGAACPPVDGDVEGERFTKRGNWGTYFEYTIK